MYDPAPNPLEPILRELRRRVKRSGQPAYQGVNELGCFAELIHHALAKTLGVLTKVDLKHWEQALPEAGHRYPPTFNEFHTAYGCRNKCSHDDEFRDWFTERWVQGSLLKFEEAVEHLDKVLISTSFRANVIDRQTICGPLRLAHTLEAALCSCHWSDSLDAMCKGYVQTTTLHPEFSDYIARQPTLRGEPLHQLLQQLARQGQSASANHFHELAKQVSSAVSEDDYREHLRPWFERNELSSSRVVTPDKLPTVRIVLDGDAGDPGFVITKVELLHPANNAAARTLDAWEDRPIDSLDELPDVVDDIADLIEKMGGPELDGIVLLIKTPMELAHLPFHEPTDGVEHVGESCRCLAVQILPPPGKRTRHTPLRGPICCPDARPTNTMMVSEPLSARQLRGRMKLQPHECLVAAGPAATARTEGLLEVVRAFKRYPLSIAELSGTLDPARLQASLFRTGSEQELGHLFERATRLRHPVDDDDLGPPVLILWDDPSYEPHEHGPLSR